MFCMSLLTCPACCWHGGFVSNTHRHTKHDIFIWVLLAFWCSLQKLLMSCCWRVESKLLFPGALPLAWPGSADIQRKREFLQKRDTPICTEKERVLAETQHTSTHHHFFVYLFVCLFGWLVGWLVVVFVVVANAVAVAVAAAAAVAVAAVAAVAVAVAVGVVVVAVAQQKPVILDALPLASAGVGG